MDAQLFLLQTKKQRLDRYRPFAPELANNLQQWFRIELTYTSNAIEGNTLTRQETALVVDEGLTIGGKSIVEHQEAINHARAWDYVQTLTSKKVADITKNTILDIHSIILDKIDDANKGTFRRVAVRLRGSETVLPSALKVPDLMEEFVDWLHTKTSEHPVDHALEAHFKLVSIHPFVDGNGRTARLLMNLLLMQAGYPPALIRKEDRSAYIHSLEKRQTKGEMADYVSIMYTAIHRSLDVYLEAVDPEKQTSADLKERFYTTEEVAQLLKVDPESVRRYVRRGDLRAVKLGGKFIRIDKVDLDTFIENRKK